VGSHLTPYKTGPILKHVHLTDRRRIDGIMATRNYGLGGGYGAARGVGDAEDQREKSGRGERAWRGVWEASGKRRSMPVIGGEIGHELNTTYPFGEGGTAVACPV
jgi:hypothetical protein